MKRPLLLLTLLLAVSCSSRGSVQTTAEAWLSDDLTVFITGFRNAACAHDRTGVMYYMDEGYVQEQLVVNLGGRRDQFINEMFGGDFDAIKSVNVLLAPSAITDWGAEPVTFVVEFNTGRRRNVRLYIRRMQGGERFYGIMGAMG